MDESSEDFWRRYQEAETFTAAKLGPAPKANPVAVCIGAFFATSLPCYFALLLAGFNGDRLQIPLISVGAISAAVAYLYLSVQSARWNRTHRQRMEETAPPSQ